LRSTHCCEKSARFGAADDVNTFDATFEGALGGFEFQDHAAGDGAILDEGLDFVARDGGDYFFSLQDAGDVGEIDELIGTEIFGSPSVCGEIGITDSTIADSSASRRLLAGPAAEAVLPGTTTAGVVLLWIAALLTLVTGYDYLKAGIRHAIDR